VACAAAIAYDIVVNRRHQPMGVMNAVFPITALYLGPFALALYWRYARAEPSPSRVRVAAVPEMAMAPAGGGAAGSGAGPGPADGPAAPARARPWWATMAIEVSHCGSGCTLGDLIAEWVVYALALTIAGYTLFAEYLFDYVFAVALGIVFQYFAIAPMRGLGVRDGLKAATKADIVSLTFFEIGLFGWMALMAFVFFPAPTT